MSKHRPGAIVAAIPLSLALLGACVESEAPRSADRAAARPNILLITLDTVRADHLGCYGYPRPLTPTLDALASRSTLYNRARATSPWTLPSHASLFTGLYPFEHGAHTVWVPLREHGKAPQRDNVRALPPEHPTLAEVLKRAGYTTAAFVANDVYLIPSYGLARGFDVYQLQRGYVDAVNARVEAWLESTGDEPFFLFVNYMDAHAPYNPAPRPDLFDPPPPDDAGQLVSRLQAEVLPGGSALPEAQLRTLVDQYDQGLANLDAGLGRLFDALSRRDLFDELLIIVTSDHGEYFGEHRLVAHSKDVYEPALRIPLLIKAPGQREGQRREEPVSLVHLPGLILSRVQGSDAAVFPYRWPDEVVISENHFSRLKDLRGPSGERFRRSRRALYREELKLIRSSDGEHELYDLSADPEEQENLLRARAEQAEALSRELSRRLVRARPQGAGDAPIPPLSDEQRERMRALGYL